MIGRLKKALGNQSGKLGWDEGEAWGVTERQRDKQRRRDGERKRGRENALSQLMNSCKRKRSSAATSDETDPSPSSQLMSTAGWEERTNPRPSQIPHFLTKHCLVLGMWNHENLLLLLMWRVCNEQDGIRAENTMTQRNSLPHSPGGQAGSPPSPQQRPERGSPGLGFEHGHTHNSG